MTPGTILTATDLTKCFNGREVLRGVTLQVARGQVCGLLGANGAGKSTTINILTGLLPQDSGTVAFACAAGSATRSATIGVAPQEPALYPRLSVSENVTFFGALHGLRGRALWERVEAALELVSLSDYRDARCSTLSGGMRRRLNLAVAVVHGPPLLILDEPTAGLDVEARYALWEVIHRLRKAGNGVLLTTHLLDDATSLCDRIALLHEGRIARQGTLHELCATVPARQIAEVEAASDRALHDRASQLGLAVRRQGGKLILLLPEVTTLESMVEQLRGAAILSIRLRPVSLEDVFFDVIPGSH